MDKYLIYIAGVGFYTGKTFKYKNERKAEIVYPRTTKNPSKAKQYASYPVSLRGLKALQSKCDIPTCCIKRLSECRDIEFD